MTETTAAKKPNSRRRVILAVGCLTPVLVLAALVGFVWYKIDRARGGGDPDPSVLSQFEGGVLGGKFVALASPPFAYNGPGRIDAYMSTGCIGGPFRPDVEGRQTIGGAAVNCLPGLVSKVTPSPRAVLVHLPAGYDPNGPPLPLVISFHGFGQRPLHVARASVSAMDEAEAAGKMPPVVLVMPDLSLSGNGLDDPRTPWEDTGYSWGINSNLGRYGDFVMNELLPWIATHYRVRTDPAGTILLGGSAGGMVAINLMIGDPRRFPNVGAFYPALDLRYSCDGERLESYDPACYRPITDDKPSRPMAIGPVKGLTGTERNLLYPVFDSDRWAGPIWRTNLPVWQRVREINPVDRLRDKKPDLHGAHLWYVVGDEDDFNIESQSPVFDALALPLGLEIEPRDHIRPGRHDIPFIQQNIADAIAWIARRLN
jgi:S-formylglutathione hydrolase FrmB